jgi:hypothetical protein
VAFEGAGEDAVQHAVGDAPSEANDDRSVAADGIASAKPVADDRVGDDSSGLLGGQPFAFARERSFLEAPLSLQLLLVIAGNHSRLIPIVRPVPAANL